MFHTKTKALETSPTAVVQHSVGLRPHSVCEGKALCNRTPPTNEALCVFNFSHSTRQTKAWCPRGKMSLTAFAEVQSPAMLNRYPGTLCTCTEWHLFPVGRAALRSRQRVHSTKGLLQTLEWHKNYGCQFVLCRWPFCMHVCHLGLES